MDPCAPGFCAGLGIQLGPDAVLSKQEHNIKRMSFFIKTHNI